MTSQPTIAIVGPGRIGQALGRLLSESGVNIGWVAARRLAAARAAARFIGAGKPVALDSPALLNGDVLLLTTTDSALPQIAHEIASRREDWKGRIVLHTSGALPAGGKSSVLAPFRERGAEVASLHPLQTVPSREAGVRNLRGSFWAVEGDPKAVRLAQRWVRALEGTASTLRAEDKPAYHAAAVVACAGVVTLMEASRQILVDCGVDPAQAQRVLGRFVAETAANFAAVGARRALTGPVMRGDWDTIRKHRVALEKRAPKLIPLYRELLHAMLRIAGKEPEKRKAKRES